LLIELLGLIDKGTLGGPAAKSVFEDMFNSGKCAADIVKEKGLKQISDADEIEVIVDRVIDANAQAVEDYRSGKEEAMKFLIGQIMRETKGRANHAIVNELLKQKLGG
jgi:aspartyl-tRNA(Asn)/glutamyl-tRNA(Gln) amidotransferase subunit B